MRSRTTTVRRMESTEEWSKGGLGGMVPTVEAVVEEELIVKEFNEETMRELTTESVIYPANNRNGANHL
jgi:hypothetical protein